MRKGLIFLTSRKQPLWKQSKLENIGVAGWKGPYEVPSTLMDVTSWQKRKR